MFKFTEEEKAELLEMSEQLRQQMGDEYREEDAEKVRKQIESDLQENKIKRDVFGLNPILMSFQTALLELEEIGMKRDCVLSILLYNSVANESLTIEEVETEYGTSIAHIIRGLVRIHELYRKSPVIESENFRNLLLSFAEDMRVVLIMISERVVLMRHIRDTENNEAQQKVAEEASYLYAPLAHKLGLYKLKSELEDLSLKYLEHDAYYMIKEKLNETKRSRDAYIEKFIKPIAEKLDAMGIKSHIKGRTKSIHSIWQKMKKQQCGFEGIYDLFAIRIIIDSPLSEEKMQCWQTYSLITDMYQPNPKRLRDWLSVPKSNGYESLHITVLGPEHKWVEVQIRTERMDEIAEKGLAAHWRYKGIKGDSGIDDWLNNIRAALEAGDSLQLMDQFKMDLYEDGVRVHAERRSAEISERIDRARLRLPHTLRRRQQVCGRQDKRQERFVQRGASLGRHNRDSDAEQSDAEAGVAEHRAKLACEVEDTPCAEGAEGEGRSVCERDARAQVQEPKDRA